MAQGYTLITESTVQLHLTQPTPGQSAPHPANKRRSPYLHLLTIPQALRIWGAAHTDPCTHATVHCHSTTWLWNHPSTENLQLAGKKDEGTPTLAVPCFWLFPSTPSCITPFSRELPGTPHDCKLLSKQACTNLQLLFYQTYRAPSYRRCLLCNMDPVLDQIESKTLIVKKKMKKNPNATEKKIVRKTVKQTSIWGLYILGRKKKSKADTWLKRQSFLPLTPKWFQE